MTTATAATEVPTKLSRIGKQPVVIPKGASVTIAGGKITMKGPKGTIVRDIDDALTIVQKDGALHVAPKPGSGRRGTQFHGLVRALLRGSLVGVSEGFKISLDLHGVGYRAELKGQDMTLALGFSHPVKYRLPDGVKATVEIIDEGGTKRPRLHLESHDKESIGRAASRIRSFRPPEPYKGKGVRYVGEKIRQKAGKAAAKTAK